MSETNYAVAPGEYFSEWLDENQQYSSEDITSTLGWNERELAVFIAGNIRITELASMRLRVLTGISSRVWMNH